MSRLGSSSLAGGLFVKPWEAKPEWCESDLYFDFSQARQVIKLDDQVAAAGLTHLLKGGVDFVVEWDTQLWLLEIKDPESGAIPERRGLGACCDSANSA